MLNWKGKSDQKSELQTIKFQPIEVASPIYYDPLDVNKTKKSGRKTKKKTIEKISTGQNPKKFQFIEAKSNNKIDYYNDYSDMLDFLEKSNLTKIFSKYNLLYYGNNSNVLNYLLKNGFEEKIDLIYIDPPFMTNSDFYKDIELRSESETNEFERKVKGIKITKQKQYEDRWELDSYLDFLYRRLQLLRRLLKPTGSIYVHLDENCVHYIRIIMDEIFGIENFRRDIVWNTASLNVAGFKGKVRNNWIYGSGHILFYTKSDNYTFNTQFTPHSDEYITRLYKYEDEGGKYKITRRNNKIYLDNDPGEPIINIWNDILSFNYAKITSKESVFYPTQKPEKLLERIIRASSNPDDIVLDCFAGSGSTLAVAQKLGRRWIGSDINPTSIQTISKRIYRMNIKDGDRNYIICENSSKKSDPDDLQDVFDVISHYNYDTNQIYLEIINVNNERITSNSESPNTPNIEDRYALIDSVFFQIRGCNPSMDQNLVNRAKLNIFFINCADVPRGKNEPIVGTYLFDLGTEVRAKSKIEILVNLYDIFNKNYIKKVELVL